MTRIGSQRHSTKKNYIYQAVQNHRPDDIFLAITLRISNITQHCSTFVIIPFTLLSIFCSWQHLNPELTKPTHSFLHQTLQGSLFLFRYTHSDLHCRCLNVEITHYEVG